MTFLKRDKWGFSGMSYYGPGKIRGYNIIRCFPGIYEVILVPDPLNEVSKQYIIG